MKNPQEISGLWQLEKRGKNFDEFLRCRQVGWFLRKVMTSFTADVEYKFSEAGDELVKKTITSGGTRVYPMPFPGEFVPKKTLSGKPERGSLFYQPGNLIQEMRFEDSGDLAARITSVVKDDKLHVTLVCKDIVCEEVYKRK